MVAESNTKPWTWDRGPYAEPNGRTYGHAICPHCKVSNKIFVWSLSGGGKRCENKDCRARFDKFGLCEKVTP